MSALAHRHGNGSFRRRVRLDVPTPGVATGALEDEMHHYRVEVEYDRGIVTAIDGDDVRVPWAICSGSLAPLSELVDTPLQRSMIAVIDRVDPTQQCTHLLDLAALVIGHAASGRPARQLDAEVPDWSEPPFTAHLSVDGLAVLDWTIDGSYTITSAPYEGVSIKGGFTRWCEANLDPDTAEAALFLQRAAWMSPARQLDLEAYPRVAESGIRTGVCWSTQPERIELAIRNRGTLRDYGPSGDELLAP